MQRAHAAPRCTAKSNRQAVSWDVRRGFCFIGWFHYSDLLDQCRRAWLTNATGGLRVEISLAPAADTSSAFLPLNWVQSFKVSPGDRVAALSK
jgi:hypothetical protein